MAAQYNLQRHVIGGFLDFIPHGSTVDSATTSALIQPDDAPITNWTDYNMGCVLNVKFDKKTQEDPDLCPVESGGYEEESNTRVIADYIDCTLKTHSEPIFRLLFGLNQKLTGATGQTPFENLGERQITGWARFRGVGGSGQALVIAKLEVKLSLMEYPDWNGSSAVRPIVRLQVKSNALNDLIDDGILV